MEQNPYYKLQVCENTFLRRMLHMPWADDDTWPKCIRRSTSRARLLYAAYGIETLTILVLREIWRFATSVQSSSRGGAMSFGRTRSLRTVHSSGALCSILIVFLGQSWKRYMASLLWLPQTHRLGRLFRSSFRRDVATQPFPGRCLGEVSCAGF